MGVISIESARRLRLNRVLTRAAKGMSQAIGDSAQISTETQQESLNRNIPVYKFQTLNFGRASIRLIK